MKARYIVNGTTYLLLTGAAIWANLCLVVSLLTMLDRGRLLFYPLIGIHIAAGWVSLMYFLMALTGDETVAFVYARLRFIGIALLPIGFFLFMLAYTGRSVWVRPWVAAGLVALPFAISGLLWFEGGHTQFFSAWEIEPVGNLYREVRTYGGALWTLHITYTTGIFLVALGLLGHHTVVVHGMRRWMITGVFFACLAIWFLLQPAQPQAIIFPLAPVAMLIVSLNTAVALVRNRLLNLMPFALPAVLRSLDAAVVILDNDNRVWYLNSLAQASVSPDVPDARGRLLEEVYPAYAREVQLYRKMETVRVQFNAPHDKRRIIELDIAPVHGVGGRVQGRVCLARDVTESISTRLKQERSQILRDFVENTTHEFRTGLAIIKSSAYLIRKGADAEHHTARIDDSVDDLVSVVDKMLELIDLDYSTSSLKASVVDINDVVQSAVEELGGKVATRKHEMKVNLADNLPTLRGNADMLHRAVRRIVHNAVSYTPEGGHIEVSTRLDGETIVVIVKDDGVGMDPAIQERIFERFFRADTAYARRGFGLGLPIAQGIVQRHGGEIRVESTLGEGSTFEIRLPTRMQSET